MQESLNSLVNECPGTLLRFIWNRKFVGLERLSASLRSEFLIASSIVITCTDFIYDESNGYNTITAI